jgi:hypothetical protein
MEAARGITSRTRTMIWYISPFARGQGHTESTASFFHYYGILLSLRDLGISLLERGFYRLPCVVFVALEIGSGRFNTSCVSLSAPERNKILRFGSSSPVSIGFLCRISICLSLFLSGASAGQIFLLFWSFRSDSNNISRENWDQQL